jgi:hypothetical protein
MTPSPADIRFLNRLQLAVDLRRAGHYDEAREQAAICANERPEESSPWHTLGQIYTELGQFTDALRYHVHAMTLFKSRCKLEGHEKQFQPLALGLAQSLMRFGRFDEAWPYWEAGRLNASWDPWPGSRYWDGSDPAPESLLVQLEGGYGDLFMFMRWLPQLKPRGVKRVGLVVWPSGRFVFDWSVFGVDEVCVINEDAIPYGKWEAATSIMSLPAVLGMKTWEDIPAFGMTRIGQWPPKRVGFCWRAEENSSPLRVKSLPWEVANDITDQLVLGSHYELLSLSPEKSDLYSSSKFNQPDYVTYEPDKMQTWAHTRDYLLTMDLVVTCDTACLHLAGNLGIPTLALLPIGACWRWRTPEERPPWYPSVNYYWQKEPLKWDADSIVAAIKERIGV